MSDDIWKRDEVDSPCVNICVIHPQAKICIGCFRTGQEISRWSSMTKQDRHKLIEALPERASTLRQTRKGRKNRIANPPKL